MIMVWAAVVLASSSYQCFVVSMFLMLTMEDSGSFFQYLLVFFFFHLYSDFLLPEYNITFVLEQIIPLFYSLILHGFWLCLGSHLRKSDCRTRMYVWLCKSGLHFFLSIITAFELCFQVTSYKLTSDTLVSFTGSGYPGSEISPTYSWLCWEFLPF